MRRRSLVRFGHWRQRRGIALLMVLVVLLMSATAAAGLARLAATSSAASRAARDGDRAEQLRRAVEHPTGPVHTWLRGESSSIVLPPDAKSPRVAILDDSFSVAGDGCSIRVTAFDQSGMAPLSLARRGSPLRLALPPKVGRYVDEARELEGVCGLDWFLSIDGRDIGIFPVIDGPLAIGEVIATHNHEPASININTAPMDLVEAAMRILGRGGIESIKAARSKGELTSLSSTGAVESIEELRLVSRSATWAFRIDIAVGISKRSWWAVYKNERDERLRTEWRCVQRLIIPE